MTVGIRQLQNVEVIRTAYGRTEFKRERDPSVRIPDEYLRCVAFVGEATGRDAKGEATGDLCATGFFVTVPFEHVTGKAAYFVTAKHVAQHLEGREIYFLVNRKDGPPKPLRPILQDQWTLHPSDPNADVAIVQVGIEPDVDAIGIGVADAATPERMAKLKIGIGDETFSIGLFAAVEGKTRNMPIVRYGNIAMLPTEQIQTDLGYTDVYLVECRSLGGISGSPVFVLSTIAMRIPGTDKLIYGTAPEITLLGMMHGHWDIRESEMNKAFFTHDRKHGVNMGVSIVVPATKILETLYRDDLVKTRQKQEQAELKRITPGMDIAERKQPRESQPFTKADFESSLTKASRKIEPQKN